MISVTVGQQQCSFIIEPAFPASDQYLNLAEVQVLDASGQQVPAGALNASMSSTWSAAYAVTACFDGVANISDNLCATRANGSLTITYDCALQPQRVVVFNRVSNDTRLTRRIKSYRVVFSGQASPVPPFYFNRGPTQAVYNVLATERCSLRIQPENDTWAGGRQHHINLAEVTAFTVDGEQIPASLLFPYMSAEWPSTPVSRCFDGLTSDAQNFCASSGAQPTLTVEYPCSQVVGRLVVHNRVAPLWTQPRILNYCLKFFGPNGTDVGLPTFFFRPWGVAGVYDIPVLCSLRVAPADPGWAGGASAPLALEEVVLQRRLPTPEGERDEFVNVSSSLSAPFSAITPAEPGHPLAACFDGLSGDAANFCRSSGPAPRLAVRYPCAFDLSAVLLFNRWANATPAERGALLNYKATFLNAQGELLPGTSAYTFLAEAPVYTIEAPGNGTGRGGRYGR